MRTLLGSMTVGLEEALLERLNIEALTAAYTLFVSIRDFRSSCLNKQALALSVVNVLSWTRLILAVDVVLRRNVTWPMLV